MPGCELFGFVVTQSQERKRIHCCLSTWDRFVLLMPSSTFLILHHYIFWQREFDSLCCQLKQAETPKKWGSVHNHRPVNKSRCTMWLHAVFRAYIRNRCPQWSLSERRTPVLPKRFAATSVSPKLTELIRVIPQHTEPQRNEHIVISLATLRV